MSGFKELVSLVQSTVGLRLREQNSTAVRSWLEERAQSLNFSREAYLSLLRGEGEEGRRERELLTVYLTTGETYFLRDPALFQLLSQRLIPDIVRLRSNVRRMRIWSAGCSTGEEAYTLAMLLMEYAPALEGWEIEIVGSDINTEALAVARRGVYRSWSFRALDEARRDRYFRHSGRHWELDEQIRRRVRFLHLDLFKDTIPNRNTGIADFDLILCRNVFIYMQPEAVAAVTARLTDALADDGYLIAGHGELVGHNLHGLRTRVFPEAVVFHKQQGATDEDMLPDLASPPSPAKRVLNLPKPRPEKTGLAVLKKPAIEEAKPLHAVEETGFQKLMREAWASANRGQRAVAITQCEQASALQPLDPWPYYLQAQIALEQGEVRNARVLLDKVIYLDEAHVAGYLELAALLDQEGLGRRAGKMRLAACRVLRGMAPDTMIKPYENSSAAEMLSYVERHLSTEPVPDKRETMRRYGT